MTGSGHGLPNDAQDVQATLADLLRHLETGWGLGVHGAIAEFLHHERDTYDVYAPEDLVVATGRGAMRIHLKPGVRLIAYEAPSKRGDHWQQGLVAVLPSHHAHMAGPEGLEDRGPDAGAVRRPDRNAALFDLGLPTDRIRACFRAGDRNLIERLRTMSGTSVFAEGGELGRTIVEAGPHRVFLSALGRIEVYQPIPKSRGDTDLLDGPHTHLLPDLFGRDGHAPWTAVVPPAHTVCLQVYPRNPLFDRRGERTSFDGDAHEKFQKLLGDWGAMDYVKAKRTVGAALRAGDPPDAHGGDGGAIDSAALKVALRQARYIEGDNDLLKQWRARFDPRSDEHVSSARRTRTVRV